MKSCNLLQLQREQLKRKAEFEEQGSQFVDAIDTEAKRVDEERQKTWNRKLIEDGRRGV